MSAERKAMEQKEKEYQERQQEILKEEEAKREAEIIALSRDHYLTSVVRPMHEHCIHRMTRDPLMPPQRGLF